MTTDVDECATNMHNCSDTANCNNTDGDYECICKAGYRRGFEDKCQGNSVYFGMYAK